MATWRPVQGYEGHYEVSDEGQIMSLRRGEPIVLAATVGRRGYRVVDLRVGGVRRARYVHQLVAEAFIGPRPDGMVTRHLDDDPLNNRATNLAYGSVIDNAQDALRNGRHPHARKTHCPQGHPYDSGLPGNRRCRTCNRAAVRRYKASKARQR